MGARVLDWMKSNQAFCVGFACGAIFTEILSIIGAYLGGVR